MENSRPGWGGNTMNRRNVWRWIEALGNRLPHPFLIFLYLAAAVAGLSAVLSRLGAVVVHPATGETVAIRNLLARDGIHWMLAHAIANFVEFEPLGLVLSMMLGIGLAERVGLVQAVLRAMITNVPSHLVTWMVVFAGILGNAASDAAFVIIPPLGALAFLAIGRHPLAGLAAGFAGVGSGFTANLLITGTDVLLSGISTEAARTVIPGFSVSPVDNWFFMCVSVFLLSLLGAWITERMVEPRLGAFEGTPAVEPGRAAGDRTERRALLWTGLVALAYAGVIALLVAPPGAFLRNPETGTIIPSPFLKGMIPILLLFFVLTGVTFGILTKKIKAARDVPILMTEAMRSMAGFIVLAFSAAQFIACFRWTHLGIFLAVSGAGFLKSIHLTGLPVVVAFILMAAFLNLFIVSGSAQWALMAPVFLPMLTLLGYHPAFVQVAFRIADSSTNTIAPLNPYLLVVLAYMQEYRRDAGLGTLLALMMPYALMFLFVWTVLLVVWSLCNLPIGPGVRVMLSG